MESLKLIVQTVCVAFLGLGTLIALFNKDDYFVKNGISSDEQSIKRTRIVVFSVNMMVWGLILLMINEFI